MKLLAYTEPDFKGELITVYEALRRRRSDPERWDGRKYYDIVRSRPMTPTARKSKDKDSSSFTYQDKAAGGGHGRGSKGIAHELAQEFLCRQLQFKFSAFNKPFMASVVEAEDEVYVVDPEDDKRKIYVDVMLTLAPDCPMREYFGDRLAIEITDTHKNSNRKIKLLKDLEMGALEVRIPTDWHVKNQTTVTTWELARLKRRIIGFWQSQVYAYLIHSHVRL